MIINFECKKCQKEFDCDIGKVSVSEDPMVPIFERDILCPKCGKVSMDDVVLTELGKSQLDEITWEA